MQDMVCFRVPHLRYLLVLLCIVGLVSMMYTNGKTPPYEPGDIEKIINCKSNLVERRRRRLPADSPDQDQTMLYLVTPTYRRAEQVAELTRLGQTLLTVPHIVWMVAEDADTCSPAVAALLDRMGMPYVHLVSPMPSEYRRQTYVPRGVSNRRAALRWLRTQDPPPAGVVYFLDDDNSIDIRLLEQMRETKRISMFPVGLVTDNLVSSPVVKDGRVTGWFDGWVAGRRFPVDMAGFALNLSVILGSEANMPYHAGYEEDKLLQALGVRMEEIELLANGCTEILVWHTKTKKNRPLALAGEIAKHPDSNIAALVENMERVAMATM